jgi:hypothetical protein
VPQPPEEGDENDASTEVQSNVTEEVRHQKHLLTRLVEFKMFHCPKEVVVRKNFGVVRHGEVDNTRVLVVLAAAGVNHHSTRNTGVHGEMRLGRLLDAGVPGEPQMFLLHSTAAPILLAAKVWMALAEACERVSETFW